MNRVIQLFIIVIMCGCSLLRPAPEEKDMPEWITGSTEIPFYYTGIGSAPKQESQPNEYIRNARQNALADMAESISIEIESSSTLSVIESNYEVSRNFSYDVVASTHEELEGYELVDTWEDENYYWAYYKLSIEKYWEVKEERKSNAVSNALSKYEQAKEFQQSNEHYNAFIFYADALAELRPYLGERAVALIDGEEKDLSNHIFSRLVDFLNNINIYGQHDEITVKRGVSIDKQLVTFHVKDKDDNPVNNFPVRLDFTGRGLMRNREASDSEGEIVCALQKVSSSGNNETLSVSIDMQELSRVSGDQAIRSIIRNIPCPEGSIEIIVDKPTVFVASTEKEFGETNNGHLLKDKMKRSIRPHFDLAKSKNEADFIINIESNTTKKDKYLNEHYIIMECKIRMQDQKGNTLFNRDISNEYKDTSYQKASIKAYNEIARIIDRSIANNIARSIN